MALRHLTMVSRFFMISCLISTVKGVVLLIQTTAACQLKEDRRRHRDQTQSGSLCDSTMTRTNTRSPCIYNIALKRRIITSKYSLTIKNITGVSSVIINHLFLKVFTIPCSAVVCVMSLVHGWRFKIENSVLLQGTTGVFLIFFFVRNIRS